MKSREIKEMLSHLKQKLANTLGKKAKNRIEENEEKKGKKKYLLLLLLFIAFSSAIATILLYPFSPAAKETVYYCIDKYSTYKKLMANNTLGEVKSHYIENGEKVSQNFFAKIESEYYLTPSSYVSGDKDVTAKIKYFDEPCKEGRTRKGQFMVLTCRIGTYRRRLLDPIHNRF